MCRLFLPLLMFLLVTISFDNVSFASPPKLHVIYIVDTKAGDVGDDIGPGSKKAYEKLHSVMSEILTEDRQERYSPQLLIDDTVTPRMIRVAIQNLRISPQDSVFVWYSGHGVVRADENHVFATSGGDISRNEVRKLILDLEPRLGLLVTDTCSSYEGQIAVPARRVPADWNGFNDLFFQSRGFVDITAATFGQFAWFSGEGGFFSTAFINTLCEPKQNLDKDKDGVLSWAEYFERVQKLTNEIFQEVKANSPEGAKITGSEAQNPKSWSQGTDPKLLQTAFSRNKWIRAGGYFELTNFPNWVESKEGELHANFRYVTEDKDYIYLIDDSRGLQLALGPYSCSFRHAGEQNFRPLYDGNWQRPSEIQEKKWTYKTGFFSESNHPEWVEWQDGKQYCKFQKIGEADGSVYLYDANRELTIRLSADRAEFRVGTNGEFSKLHEGSWDR